MKPTARFVPYLLLAVLVLGSGLGIGLGLSEAPTAYGVEMCMDYRQGAVGGTVCEPNGVSYAITASQGTRCPDDLLHSLQNSLRRKRPEPPWVAIACYTQTRG